VSDVLRCLMRPGDKPGKGHPQYGFRWVRELNGHPGRCAEDHWHSAPEGALRCFRGAADPSMPDLAGPATTTRRAS
jgi:hypothetical protein